MRKGKKTNKERQHIIDSIILFFQLIISVVIFPIGILLMIFDGYCAGGSFCTQPPGFMSFLGALLMVFSLSQFAIKTPGRKRIISIAVSIAIALIIYLIRVILFIITHGTR